MPKWIAPHGSMPDALFLVQNRPNRILKVLKKPYNWNDSFQTTWVEREHFWDSFTMRDQFPRDPENPIDVFDFKDKTYARFRNEKVEGYTKVRCVDNLEGYLNASLGNA